MDYRICPNRSAVPNRRAGPSSNNISHVLKDKFTPSADKTSKDHQETVTFERYSGLFGCHTCKNHHFFVNKGPHDSCYHKYVYIQLCCRYRTTGFITEIFQACTTCASIRTYTVSWCQFDLNPVEHPIVEKCIQNITVQYFKHKRYSETFIQPQRYGVTTYMQS